MAASAEWSALDCGRCRINVAYGSSVDDEIDPSCETHRPFRCAKCGESADGDTISHGGFGSNLHVPVRP